MKKRIQPKIKVNKKEKANVFITVESPIWRQPNKIDVEALGEILEINIGIVDFIDQDVSINRPPDTYPINSKLEIAVDKNFLYVWVKDRWKRIPLTEF